MDDSYLVSGILKGYDPLVNLVLDETIEYLQGITRPRAGVLPCGLAR
mgnify:CR=1 FL=1